MSFGPWNPGIQSQVPHELRHLSTLFRPEHSFTSVAAATELRQLTGLPLSELATFRPQRLVLHELMIRVMADFSVPTGEKIGDLGINFRDMSNRLLHGYLEPRMPSIVAVYNEVRRELEAAIAALVAQLTAPRIKPRTRWFSGRGLRAAGGASNDHSPRAPTGPASWGPEQISGFDREAAATDEPLKRAAYRALARVMSALFTTHGRAWGTPELICSLATDMACNTHGSSAIGRHIEPIVRQGAAAEGFALLPRQDKPVIINTKGPSASGKSSLRPLQKKLAGDLGVRWADFALISPDIFRKQLLDYNSLGAAYKYAGAFTSEELQIVDQKLDRYMAQKQARGEMAHLLIDRFRFDSFAPDSDEAGSNLLTRFGDSVYLFFLITPPEQLVERAWARGLEFGRYKAVDDTLAHSVEAYTGMPNVFFTWVHRADKRIRMEFLDNTVPFGQLPKTVAFGDNHTLNVLDVEKLLDIERFGRVDVDAAAPEKLYPDPTLLAAERNLGFLQRCIRAFREVNFADQKTGRIYLRIRGGERVQIDTTFPQDPVLQRVVAAGHPVAIDQPLFLEDTATLGEWGHSQPRKSP